MSDVYELKLFCLKTELPPNITEYSPEDTTHILKMGVKMLEYLKTEKTSDLNPRIKKLEQQLEFQQEHYKLALQENLDLVSSEKLRWKDILIADLRKTLDQKDTMIADLKRICETNEKDVALKAKTMYEYETGHQIENFRKELDRLHLETQKIHETTHKKKSLVEIGDEGEAKFQEYAEEAFRFFPDFYLKDVSDIAGKGDFHLFFKEFAVLVDVKNGQAMVDNTMLEKMRADMNANTLSFGWLISMNSQIRNYNKYPIMFEWISETKCLCHVNSLLKQSNPVEHLRLIYSVCKTIQLLMTTSGDSSNRMFDEYEKKMMALLRDLDMNAKEEASAIQDLLRTADTIKTANKKTRELLRTMLTEKTNELVEVQLETVAQERNQTIVKDWIDGFVKGKTGSEPIKTKDLWDAFKQDNKKFKKTVFDTILKDHYTIEKGILKI